MYDKTFQARVWPIIMDLMDDTIAPVFDGKLAYKVPISLTDFPNGVYQSQDGGGKNDDYINQNGWQGFVTIRSIDTTLSGAWNKALQVATVLSSGVIHPNYDITAEVNRPIELPIEKITAGSIYTAGLIVLFGIYPK